MTGTAPLRPISDEEIEAFEREGFVVLRDVLSPEWLAPLNGACERLLAAPETLDITDEAVRLAQPITASSLFGATRYATTLATRGHFYVHFNTAREDDAVMGFALRGAVGGIAAAVLRSPTVRFIDDIMFVKEPHTEESTEWHDDDGGGITTGKARCSLWIPLGDVPEAAGPLRLLRGSHRDLAGWRKRGLNADDLVAAQPDNVVVCPVELGDVVAHKLEVIHGTGPNESSIARRSWAMRFGGEGACFAPSPLRGEETVEAGIEAGGPLSGARFPVAWPPAEP